MKGKRIFYCELAYFLGIVVLAFGTALMEKADFGMSMVVAPAYLIHLKISEYVRLFHLACLNMFFRLFCWFYYPLLCANLKRAIFCHLSRLLYTEQFLTLR